MSTRKKEESPQEGALEVSRALVERLADSLLLLPRHKWRKWQGLACDPRGDKIEFGFDDATQSLYELHGGVRRPLVLEEDAGAFLIDVFDQA